MPYRMFEAGGVKVAVLGEAFAYTPVANPRWMIPKWTFGIREDDVRANVEKARREGAQLVVLLSHNGFDCDRKLATRVAGIDVILTAHTHDALPVVTQVGRTLLIASGSNGKFLSRLDLDVQGGAVRDFRYKLIPAVRRRDRSRRRDARCDRAGARAVPGRAHARGRPHRRAAVPPRHVQRHARRHDLRGADRGARRRDRALARLPLGDQHAAGQPDHRGGHPQRDRDHLSERLPDADERRAAEGDFGRRRRQPVQPRSILPAGRRHGPLRRPRLHHRSRQAGRQPHFGADAH